MKDDSIFSSRTGRLSCTDVEFFGFITDLRNLEQFIPEGSLKNWQATDDFCSFGAPPLGTVKVWISEKRPFSSVIFSGDVLNKNDVNLNIQINNMAKAEVRLILTANFNPVLKMMASGPIEKFLETLISEMEKFDKWNDIFTEKQLH